MKEITMVEINNTKWAFHFHTFEGKNSIERANNFCKWISKIPTLSAYVRKTVNV